MKERRRHPRLSIMGLVRVTLSGEPKSREAYLANISWGGIGIYLHKKVQAGQKLRITVQLKNREGQEEEDQIGAHVSWSNPIGDLCMAGLQFEEMTKEKYAAVLKSFVW